MMQLKKLHVKKKRVQRLLHITKRKKLACKLYLQGKPEQASREMQHYLFTLEQQHRNPRDFVAGFLGVLTACILLIVINGITTYSFTYGASFILVLFLGGLFFVPYIANQYHMGKTRRYIESEVIPELEDRISWLNQRIKKLQQQIEEEQKRYEAWRQSSGYHSGSENRSSRNGLSRQEALSILNLEEPVNFDDVRKAYRKQVIKHHPDRMAGGSPQELERAQEITIRLNQAYSHLKKVMQPESG